MVEAGTEHLGDKIIKKVLVFCSSKKTLYRVNLIGKKSQFKVFSKSKCWGGVGSELQNATNNRDLRTHLVLPIKLGNKGF